MGVFVVVIRGLFMGKGYSDFDWCRGPFDMSVSVCSF